jgi:hypothetical protein
MVRGTVAEPRVITLGVHGTVVTVRILPVINEIEFIGDERSPIIHNFLVFMRKLVRNITYVVVLTIPRPKFAAQVIS